MLKVSCLNFTIKLLLSLILIFPVNSLFASSFIKGKSNFSSMDGDSLVFIKSQLLSKAFTNIIDQELTSMGHDNNLFWQTYNEKFDRYFEPILEKLRNKMGMDNLDESEKSVRKKQKYFKLLRHKKLKLKARFGKLDKVIKSYAIEKLSRSSQFPNSRYMRVKAIVNRKKLNKMYFKFIRTEKNRFYPRLFVTIDFKLNGVSWSELGVEVEKDMKDVVGEHWKRWLQDNLKSIVGDVIIASDDDKIKLSERFKMPLKNVLPIDITSPNEADIGTHMILEDKASGALWLKVNLEIKGNETDPLLQVRECFFNGDLVLIDMNNNNLLSHKDFVSQSIDIFEKPTNKDLNSRAAGVIYRLPISHFLRFPKILSSISNNKRFVEISIRNTKSMKEIYGISKILQEKGVRVDANFNINYFSKEVTKGVLSYRGEKSKLEEILSQINGLVIEASRIIQIIDKDHPFQFEVITKMEEVK